MRILLALGTGLRRGDIELLSVSGLNSKQEKILIDRFNEYRWKQIRQKLWLGDFTFHDLRKTFGSVLAQNGVSRFHLTRHQAWHILPD